MTGVLAVAVTAKRFVMELSSRVAKAKRITEVDVPMICLLTISRHGHNSSIQGMKPASRTTFVRQKPCVLSSCYGFTATRTFRRVTSCIALWRAVALSITVPAVHCFRLRIPLL